MDPMDEARKAVTMRWRVLSWLGSIARPLGAWDVFCKDAT